jgi:predicted GNAT family acetyltransferase
VTGAPTTDTPRHEPDRQRFVLVTGDSVSLLTYRPVGPTTLDYAHTFVPPELRGRGVASRLARFALDYARQQGLKVAPTCPFVAAYMEAHPEYRDLLAD